MCGEVTTVTSDQLSKWLTLLANIGVLAGLAILILEIRQNNEIAMAQIEQSRSESLTQWRRERVTNDHIAPLIVRMRALSSEYTDKFGRAVRPADNQRRTAYVLDKLEDPVDRYRAESWIMASYYDFETIYFQYRRGLVSQDYWEGRIVPAILDDAPEWNAVRDGRAHLGRKEFSDDVEHILIAEDERISRGEQ
jgi:hypothetical protein